MFDGERMDYIFIIRNAIEVYRAELNQAKLLLEKRNAEYISAMIAYDIAIETYESRIEEIRILCKHHGLTDSEIDNLIKWHDGE